MDQQSDRERFEELYRSTYQDVVAYCRRRIPAADSEDVVAETYLVAWRRLDEVLSAEFPLAWLYAVAYRTISNQHRSTRRIMTLRKRLQGLPTSTVLPPDAIAEARADLVRSLASLERLSQKDRELIRLAALERLSYDEIAQVVGKSPAAVRSQLFRARVHLREVFDSLDEDSESEDEANP
ncbi:MAG: RNA polymerase sigma factor [Acidimicrobiia bacterium]